MQQHDLAREMFTLPSMFVRDHVEFTYLLTSDIEHHLRTTGEGAPGAARAFGEAKRTVNEDPKTGTRAPSKWRSTAAEAECVRYSTRLPTRCQRALSTRLDLRAFVGRLTKVPPELFAQVLGRHLQQVGGKRKLYRFFVEAILERLGADCVWIMGGDSEILALAGDPALAELVATTAFFRNQGYYGTTTRIMAKVFVHDRIVAVTAAARRDRPFAQSDRRRLDRLCGLLAQELTHRDERRLVGALDRIRGYIFSELRPKDLAYQILDRLGQLVGNDHSSALFTYRPEAQVFRVEAEKIVWEKAKSIRIGREISAGDIPGELMTDIECLSLSATARGLGEAWNLVYSHRSPGSPDPTALLLGKLKWGGNFFGLLMLASWKRQPFDNRDIHFAAQFLSPAAVAIRKLRQQEPGSGGKYGEAQRKYDVAVSYAVEDGSVAERIATVLRGEGLRVFFDRFETGDLWGRDLYQHLYDIYSRQALFCIVLISKNYIAEQKKWTRHELRAAQERQHGDIREYILPLRLDDTPIPGLPSTVAYLTYSENSLGSIVEAVKTKIAAVGEP